MADLPSEITFTHAALLALSKLPGVRVWRQNAGKILTRSGGRERVFEAAPPGAADISGIVGPEGWRLEIEMKMPRGKRSDAQEAWAAMCAKHGALYLLFGYHAEKSLETNVAELRAVLSAKILLRRQAETEEARA